jgi:hypothetical protein
MVLCVRVTPSPPERSAWLADSVTRMMRSGVTPKCGTTLTEVALATRKFSLVGKRVEGVCEGFETGDTIITAAERKHLI